MPTVDLHDEDALGRLLGSAFADSTADLTYTGRVPAPRRVPLVALPVAVAGVAGLAVVGLAGRSSHAAAPIASGPPRFHGPAAVPSTPPASAQPELVRQSLQVAGTTYSYTQAATDEPLYARPATGVPAGAEQVTSPQGNTFVAKGADGTWGAYVKAPDGSTIEITSRTATHDQLVALLQGPPRVVPYVSSGS